MQKTLESKARMLRKMNDIIIPAICDRRDLTKDEKKQWDYLLKKITDSKELNANDSARDYLASIRKNKL